MRNLWFVSIAVLLSCLPASGEKKDLQQLVVDLAPTASEAVIPIQIWYDKLLPTGMLYGGLDVVGTGFFVDRNGDFITAGHVIDALTQYQQNPALKNSQMSALIPQKSGGGMTSPFTITDRDADHDIVLCHLTVVHGITPLKPTFPNGGNTDVSHAYASLAISTGPEVTGRFVVLSGFPIGSWTPAVQLGMVAATEYMTPNSKIYYEATIHKDARDLLQLSINANHGNSGGPAIDVETGKVVGMIDQFVPAPMNIQGKQVMDPGTFIPSGLILAAPAKWIEELLEKNNIKSEAVAGGHWMTKWP